MLERLRLRLNISWSKALAGIALVSTVAYAAQNFNSINVNGNITVTGNVDGRDVSADGSVIDAITANGVTALTSSEVDQLENINATTISSTTWGHLGGIDQALSSTSSPTFNSITGTLTTAAQPNITSLGTLTALSVDAPLNLLQQTTPANPAASRNKLYFKSDDKLYRLTAAGVETEVGSGGTSFDDSIFEIYDDGDISKLINFEAAGITPGQTRTITMADANIDLSEISDATASNNAGTIVKRNGSGDFAAGTITAALTGNASTATALQTARNINGTAFDGTANITVTAAAGTLTGTTLNSSVVTSSLTSVGTITTGVWNGTAIAYANLAALTTNRVLVSDGSGFVSVSSVPTANLPKITAANITYSAGTPTVTNEYGGDWISSITDGGTGQPTLNVSGFTTAPACTCNGKESAVSGSACTITGTSTSTITIRMRDLAGTFQDEHLFIICTEWF